MTDRLRELLGKLTEGCEPGPWRPEGDEDGDWAARGWWLENPGGDASFPDADDMAAFVNEVPALLDAHDRMAGALRDAYDAMDAASKWAVHQGPERDRHGDVTPEAADRHIAGFDALLDAQVRAGQALGILSGGAALAVPKEENPRG